MGQNGAAGRALGLSSRFKHVGRLLILFGVLLMVTGLSAETASASTATLNNGNPEPTLHARHATFMIPANNPPHRVFVLSLWSIIGPKQHFLGEDYGTSGLLVVKVPATPGCDFQVDVDVHHKFYSGFKRQLTNCGKTVGTTTTTTSGGGGTTTTTTKPKGSGTTTTTTKPSGTTSTTVKTKSGGGGGTTTTTAAGGTTGTTGGGTTTAPSGQLAFTGTGVGLWLTALFGLLLVMVGGIMILYARRYPRAA
jgi:hypothetical protein